MPVVGETVKFSGTFRGKTLTFHTEGQASYSEGSVDYCEYQLDCDQNISFGETRLGGVCVESSHNSKMFYITLVGPKEFNPGDGSWWGLEVSSNSLQDALNDLDRQLTSISNWANSIG